jgi:hypothetical protein
MMNVIKVEDRAGEEILKKLYSLLLGFALSGLADLLEQFIGGGKRKGLCAVKHPDTVLVRDRSRFADQTQRDLFPSAHQFQSVTGLQAQFSQLP